MWAGKDSLVTLLRFTVSVPAPGFTWMAIMVAHGSPVVAAPGEARTPAEQNGAMLSFAPSPVTL